MVYVMGGCLFLWDGSSIGLIYNGIPLYIVLPSRPDMQKNALPLCYGNDVKMKPRKNDLYVMEQVAS